MKLLPVEASRFQDTPDRRTFLTLTSCPAQLTFECPKLSTFSSIFVRQAWVLILLHL